MRPLHAWKAIAWLAWGFSVATISGCALQGGRGDLVGAEELSAQAREQHVIGNYAEAQELYERALHIRQLQLGNDDPLVAESLRDLGVVFLSNRDYDEARPLLSDALAIREKVLDPNDPAIAESLGDLANLHSALGQFVLAAPLLERALAIRENALPPDHPKVARSLLELGAAYRAMGDYVRAETLFQQALESMESRYGPDHREISRPLRALGLLYHAWGHYVSAEPLLKRALAIREKAYIVTPQHPDIAESVRDLGMLYYAMGDYPKAEPYLQRALALREQAFYPSSSQVPSALADLGMLYYKMEDYERAEPLLERALELYESESHPNSRAIAKLMSTLGFIFTRVGYEATAQKMLTRALQMDPTSPRLYLAQAAEYERLGRRKDALESYESALLLDQNQPLVKNNLAWLLAASENPSPEDLDRALELAHDARYTLPDQPNVADTLGWVLLKAGSAREAIPYFQEAIDGQLVGAEARCDARYHLAQAYAESGQSRRAVVELEQALDESASFPERGEAQTLLARLRRPRSRIR